MAKYAIIKFNGGRGALLCNRCHWILREDFHPKNIEDKKYYCEDFEWPRCQGVGNYEKEDEDAPVS